MYTYFENDNRRQTTGMKSLRLNSEDESFFTLVDKAVKANPFSKTRVELDLKITGLASGISTKDRISYICKAIEHKFQNRKINPAQYKGREKDLLQSSVLFLFFHLFLEKFDTHIKEQIKAKVKA
jgi:hypothetical protein